MSYVYASNPLGFLTLRRLAFFVAAFPIYENWTVWSVNCACALKLGFKLRLLMFCAPGGVALRGIIDRWRAYYFVVLSFSERVGLFTVGIAQKVRIEYS
jgi:hypothetical protein